LKSLSLVVVAAIFYSAFNATNSLAQVAIAPRQMWVLKPGQDRVFGTWVAAVMNKSLKAETFRLPVLLPENVGDFQVSEGVAQSELKLETDGLWIEKNFEPGVNVVSLSFMVPAFAGKTKINATTRSDVGELTVMTPAGMMSMSSSFFKAAQSEPMEGQTRYNVMVSTKFVAKGDSWAIDVIGVPEGRLLLWVLGGVFGGVLVVGASLMYWRTRKLEDLNEVVTGAV
jgi:hypothetical protein